MLCTIRRVEGSGQEEVAERLSPFQGLDCGYRAERREERASHGIPVARYFRKGWSVVSLLLTPRKQKTWAKPHRAVC